MPVCYIVLCDQLMPVEWRAISRYGFCGLEFVHHMRSALVLTVAGFLASCVLAPDDTVRDSSTAIMIARATCGDGAPMGDWHADLSGNYWRVWSGGKTYDEALVEVIIAKHDGKAMDCGLAIH
jgi:hypothetical protein